MRLGIQSKIVDLISPFELNHTSSSFPSFLSVHLKHLFQIGFSFWMRNVSYLSFNLTKSSSLRRLRKSKKKPLNLVQDSETGEYWSCDLSVGIGRPTVYMWHYPDLYALTLHSSREWPQCENYVVTKVLERRYLEKHPKSWTVVFKAQWLQ